MAYVVPSAADLVALYPAFAAVPDVTIEAHIATASTTGVDTSWLESDYAPAINALAAHNMQLLSIGDHGQVAAYAGAGVTSIRSGNFNASFSDQAVARASAGGYGSTAYGREYQRLLKRSKGGIRVVSPPLTDCGWGPLAIQNDGGILPWDC